MREDTAAGPRPLQQARLTDGAEARFKHRLAETRQEPITEPQQETNGTGAEPAAAPRARARRRQNQPQEATAGE